MARIKFYNIDQAEWEYADMAVQVGGGETYYPVVLDWINDIGSAIDTYPLGWRSGYWTDTRTVGTNSNYICTASKLRAYKDDTRYSHAFFGVAKVAVSLPENTTLVVKEWNKDDASAPTHRYDLVNGDSFPVNFNCDYGFNINVNSTYITEEYLSTIKLTMYRKTRYRVKTTEFERFTVKTNLNWANISSTSSDNAETTNYVNRRAFIALPDTYSATEKPTPVIMLSHGSGGSITGSQINGDNADNLALIRAFTNAGYAVFDVDNTQANSSGWNDWGCLPLVTEYINAWRHIILTYNVNPLLNIYSMSMGTTAALNILKWRPFPVKTAVMSAFRPVCETVYNASTTSETARQRMATAFGLSGTSWEHDRLKGFNQYENKIVIDNTEYILENFPEVKVLIGQSDTNYLTESRAYVAALQNAGNYVNCREIENAVHDDMCFLRLGAMKQEVINWFDRFNK